MIVGQWLSANLIVRISKVGEGWPRRAAEEKAEMRPGRGVGAGQAELSSSEDAPLIRAAEDCN
jgi:hypothetical protein